MPRTAVRPAARPRPAAVRAALTDHGRTYAQEAGLALADTPSALYRLLVLTVLMSNRIPAATAVATARVLWRAGLRTPGSVVGTTWERRAELLVQGGYRRFAGRTASVLGDGAALVAERWHGDLRRLRAEAAGDVDRLRAGLEEVPGIGRVGSAVFCREVQGTWPELAPFVDERVLAGARVLGLPSSVADLAAVAGPDLVELVAACVRASFTVARATPAR